VDEWVRVWVWVWVMGYGLRVCGVWCVWCVVDGWAEDMQHQGWWWWSVWLVGCGMVDVDVDVWVVVVVWSGRWSVASGLEL